MRSRTLFVLFACLAVVLVATSSRQDLTASPQQAFSADGCRVRPVDGHLLRFLPQWRPRQSDKLGPGAAVHG